MEFIGSRKKCPKSVLLITGFQLTDRILFGEVRLTDFWVLSKYFSDKDGLAPLEKLACMPMESSVLANDTMTMIYNDPITTQNQSCN